MRLTLFTNYLNAHMLPLSLALDALEGVDFTFVALSDEPGDVGRPNLNDDYEFVVRAYEDAQSAECARAHALEDEVVVFGHMGGDETLVKERMSKGLLTFRQAERVLKRGAAWRFFPLKALRTHDWFVRYRNKPYYVLCTGAYAAHDLALAGFPAQQCLTWGYYLDGQAGAGQATSVAPRGGTKAAVLLWAGRMIGWKHPEAAISLAESLRNEGRDFHLVMAGDGPLREQLAARVAKCGLEQHVSFAGLLEHNAVLDLMDACDLFLFTSDRREGWGVTLSEAMAKGCAVVASSHAGSTLALVNDGTNGLVYDGSQEDLHRAVASLLDDGARVRALATAARVTMQTDWSAETAAANLIATATALLNGQDNPVTAGPCSPALLR